MNNMNLLDDLSKMVGKLLSERGNELDPSKQRQLQDYQRDVDQYRYNPQPLENNPGMMDGLLGRIIQIAGPLLAGYATHQLLQRLGQSGAAQSDNTGPEPFDQGTSGPFDRSLGGSFDQSSSGPFDRSLSSSQGEEPVQRQSTSRGQSVEEG